MKHLLILLSPLLISAAACNEPLITGADEDVQNLPGAPPGSPQDSTTGAGEGAPDPLDPLAEGSTGVRLGQGGGIIIDPEMTAGQSPLIWVANSGEGTVSKIDTRAMKEIARYYTYPGGGADPSRTTVSLVGDVVVANRANNDGRRASALKIAGSLDGCVDRNKNGKIDTSKGEGLQAAIQWPSGEKSSPDECVLWLTDLSDAGGAHARPRAAGWNLGLGYEGNLTEYVYVGLHDIMQVARLDGRTGAILKRIPVAPTRPYGLVIDSNDNVWVRGADQSLARIDVSAGDAVAFWNASNRKAPPCAYGITADSLGRIYTAGGSCVSRFDPRTESWEKFDVPHARNLRGVAVDQRLGIWIAATDEGMYHVDGSASPMVYKGRVDISAGYSVGAAIDFDGRPWVISRTLNRAHKIDPSNYSYQSVQVGSGPYTYSDMTGFQLRNATPVGVFRKTLSGCSGRTHWTRLDFDLIAPAETHVVLRARAADTQADLSMASWADLGVVPPAVPPLLLALPDANYMQVEFKLVSRVPKLTPILSAVRAAYQCILQ